MKKRIAKMMLLAAAAFSLTACGGSGGNQEAEETEETSLALVEKETVAEEDLVPQKGGMLKIGLEGSPKNLDPKNRTSVYESRIISQVCDTLIIYNNDQTEYLPSLAESWEISDWNIHSI